jgi:multidrug efflux system membrane fusion protein
VDLVRFSALEAQACSNVGVARANLETARLYLGFTKVTSPIDGIVSRFYYTLGNLVNQDQTLLTTIVSYDPMYAYFDMEERVVLRLRNMINTGQLKVPADATNIPILMALEGEEGFPHKGTFDFVNNTVNPSTGTIAVRAVFPNPAPPNGRRLLTPGMFVRIRVPIGTPQPALLVIDRALGSDQGLKFLYVVGEGNKVRSQRVAIGPLQDDGLRVISNGLKADDWVVVGALQQVRANAEISPEKIPMPTLNESAEPVPSTKSNPQSDKPPAEQQPLDNSPAAKSETEKANSDKSSPPAEKKADEKKPEEKKAEGKKSDGKE